MNIGRKFLYFYRIGILSLLLASVIITIFSAIRGVGFYFDTIFVLKHVLVSGPAVLDLFMIVLSFYLMLDGVYRWGIRKDGAFSRTLIGLFILHTSSVELPYVPYIALLLEFALCIRTAQLNRKEREQEKQASFFGSFLEIQN